MRLHHALPAALTASALIGSVVGSELQAQEAADLRVDAQLVLVDVVARSSEGAVDDLTASDFTLFDEGIRQEIAVFERTLVDGEPEEVQPLPPGVVSNMRDWRGAAPPSATVILLDRLNTPTEDQIYVDQQLLEFVESFGDLDRIALYELSDGLRTIHDYTASPEALLPAVAALEPEHSLSLASSDNLAGFEAGLNSVGADRELEVFLSEGGLDRRTFEGQSADYFLDSRVQRTLEALETIVYHMRGLPGRKNLVWLSGRFPFTFDPWSRTDLVDEVDRSTVEWMEEVGFLLSNANVAVYPVDVRGPGVDGDSEFNGVILTVAEMTGGRPFYGTNRVAEAIAEAVDDARAVYTLGFYPPALSSDGDFRKIAIEVSRDGAELQHRSGYFSFRGSANAAPARSLADYLTGPLDATAVTLVGRAAPAPAQSGDYEVLVLAEVEDLNLVERDGMWTGEIDFVGFFQSAESDTSSLLPSETIPIRLTDAQHQQALLTGFLLRKTVSTDGQTGRIRFVVRDRTTGSAGSLWVPVGLE